MITRSVAEVFGRWEGIRSPFIARQPYDVQREALTTQYFVVSRRAAAELFDEQQVEDGRGRLTGVGMREVWKAHRFSGIMDLLPDHDLGGPDALSTDIVSN
jgi:hypothetical protein